MQLRTIARELVLGVAVVLARAATRWSGRRAGVAVVYHVLSATGGDPNRELVPAHAVALFERQLRHLARHYAPVSASELHAAVVRRRRWQRFPVAVTLDDDLASHATLAAPVLRRLGIPATFFLTGATLNGPTAFWWQRLQQAADSGRRAPVAGADVHAQAAVIEALSPAERARVIEQLPDVPPEETAAAVLTRDAVAELANGFEIGFHTLRHDRLTALDSDALHRALTDGRRELERAIGRPVTAVAYPHGKADATIAEAARGVGFSVGFTGEYEPIRGMDDPLLLPRVEPTFESTARFARQLVALLLRPPHR